MSNVEIKTPDVAHIIITGPTQCGKSIIMDRIEKLLRDEFSANVVSDDLANERKCNSYDNLEYWQKQMVKETVWIITEK